MNVINLSDRRKHSINGPSFEFEYSNGSRGRAANLLVPASYGHEAYQFGSEWSAAVYDQNPDLFAANYFGMTVPQYRKWVIEGPVKRQFDDGLPF